MRLRTSIPATKQIIDAVSLGVPLCMDARTERMGDKAAIVAVAKWISSTFGACVTILESAPGRTPFMLSDYELPLGVDVAIVDPLEPIEDMLDVHTCGNQDSLWILNPYLATQGCRSKLQLREDHPKRGERTDAIVFGALLNTEYNHRRDMHPAAIRETINVLAGEYPNVVLLLAKPDDRFPEATVGALADAIDTIATASCFIGGDSGFGHVAAAFGTPVVSIYPDWWMHQMPRLGDAIVTAEWWGLPTHYTPKSFLPNASQLRVVELGTDGHWSIEHVLRSIATLSPEAVAVAA